MEGNRSVEKYMEPVGDAIKRHIKGDSREATDIYNRAYEAVWMIVREDEAIVKELVETLELVVDQLESPEVEVVREAIAKVKEGS
jgi:hypothetical protein